VVFYYRLLNVCQTVCISAYACFRSNMVSECPNTSFCLHNYLLFDFWSCCFYVYIKKMLYLLFTPETYRSRNFISRTHKDRANE